MQRSAYFREAGRLANAFGDKLHVVQEFLEADPELKAPGAYEKYWDLESEAQAAGGEWTNFCAEQRPLIDR